MRIDFDDFVEMLVDERNQRKAREQEVKVLKRQNGDLIEALYPGTKAAELERALDGEIRLLREQG